MDSLWGPFCWFWEALGELLNNNETIENLSGKESRVKLGHAVCGVQIARQTSSHLALWAKGPEPSSQLGLGSTGCLGAPGGTPLCARGIVADMYCRKRDLMMLSFVFRYTSAVARKGSDICV